jgi:hypothetical protein
MGKELKEMVNGFRTAPVAASSTASEAGEGIEDILRELLKEARQQTELLKWMERELGGRYS